MLGSLNLGSIRGFLTSFNHREGAGRKPYPAVCMLKARAGLSLYYVLKYVGEAALSGLPMFSAASRFRTKHSML